MKKTIAIFTALLMVVFTMTACGGTTPATSTSQAAADTTSAAATDTTPAADAGSGEAVELVVWESTNGPDEFIRQAGAKFTEQNPNVTIKFVNIEMGDAAGQIALDGPAGVGPDLFAAPHDKLGELVVGGHVLPTVNAGAVSSAVLGACSQALTYDGTMYGYPVSAETYVLFYNKDLIPEADVPTTWDGVIEFSKGFNSGDKYGFVMDVANAYYTILFTTADGNRLFGPSGDDATNTYLNNAASVKGMQSFVDLRSVLNVDAADLSTSFCDAAFAGGMAAMYVTGPWNIAPFTEAGINFGTTTLPSLPGMNTPASSFSGTRAMFVSAYSNHPEEAAAFGEFLISEEMQKLRFDITGAFPSIDVTVDSPYVPGIIGQLDNAFPMPSIPQMSKFWDSAGAACSNIWNGADLQAELDALNAAILAA